MSVRSVSSSQRSGAAAIASQAAAVAGDNNSVRSERTVSAGRRSDKSSSSSRGGSTRSVTSSVAYEQLKQLEAVLTKERQAREEAERTLQYLQNEKADKDANAAKAQHSERQLQTLLKQLQRVISDGGVDASKIRALQRYALQGATSATPSERSVATGGSRRSSSSSNNNSGRRGAAGAASGGGTGVAAAAAAGGGASTPKPAVSFFEKFGRGEARQHQVLDRAMAQGAGPAAGMASGAASSLHKDHVAAVGSRGSIQQPRLATFTHRKTDLVSQF